jgi:hypothetical protein
MAKEAYDDIQRYQRDKVMNEKHYKKIDHTSKMAVDVKA